MKVPEKYYCDICGKEIDMENANRHHLSGRRMSVKTDSGSIPERLVYIDMDICLDCLKKSVVIQCGFQGEKPHFIEPVPAKEAYTAEQFAHDRARMCQRTNCCTCPLSSTARGESSVVCSQLPIHHPAEAVEIVRKWAADHLEADTE